MLTPKTVSHALLTALALLCSGYACSPTAASLGSGTEEASNEACAAKLQGCLESGMDAAACDTLHQRCLDNEGSGGNPGLDPEACEQELELCLQQEEPAVCDQRYASCRMGTHQPPSDCTLEFDRCMLEGRDPIECDRVLANCRPTSPTPCVTEFENCLDGGEDPVLCEQQMVACNGGNLGCVTEFEHCLRSDEDPVLCEQQLRACDGSGQQSPCQSAYESCLRSGEDPALCEQQMVACNGGNLDCVTEFEHCLRSDEDPVLCEQQLQACDGSGQQPSCQSAHESCLRAGEDPVLCEQQLTSCEGGGSDCVGEFESCQDSGMDPQLCDRLWAECHQPEEPQYLPCEFEFTECLRSGIDPDDCHEELTVCQSGLPMPDYCGEHYQQCVDATHVSSACAVLTVMCYDQREGLLPDGTRWCSREFDACMDMGVEPMGCEILRGSCEARFSDPVDPTCDAQYQECMRATGDPNHCEPALARCRASCEASLDACLAAGNDPAICNLALEECQAGSTPPEPFCAARFQGCLEVLELPTTCEVLNNACLADAFVPMGMPWCDYEHAICMTAPNEPASCDRLFEQCVTRTGDGVSHPADECEVEFNTCVTDTDDVGGCEAKRAACLISKRE